MNDRVDNASIVDGRMTLPGVAGAFVQDAARPLAFTAEALVAVSGHAWRDGALHDAGRIEGAARPDGARLARIGQAGPAPELSLTIRAFPGESAPLLRLSLPAGAQGDLDERLAAELFLPQPLFAGLRRDLAEGRAGHLSFAATTNLWLREGASDDEPVFHLAPEADGRPAQAHGRVHAISWRAVSSGDPGWRAAAQPEHLAEGEPPEDPVAEQLRRINWSLKQVLIVLAFLMLIVALK